MCALHLSNDALLKHQHAARRPKQGLCPSTTATKHGACGRYRAHESGKGRVATFDPPGSWPQACWSPSAHACQQSGHLATADSCSLAPDLHSDQGFRTLHGQRPVVVPFNKALIILFMVKIVLGACGPSRFNCQAIFYICGTTNFIPGLMLRS